MANWHPQPFDLAIDAPNRDLKFVVDQFLPHGYLTILAGEPKCGKTSFATTLALSIALGDPFLGMPVEQGAVIWLCLEEGFPERLALMHHLPPETRKRVHTNPPPGMPVDSLPIYNFYDFKPIDTDEGITDLINLIEILEPKLVVIDSLHASHSGRSLSDGWNARKTLKKLKALTPSSYPAILVIHHLGGTHRHRRVAESAQLSAVASLIWLLEERPQTTEARQYNLTCRGRGSFANQRLALTSHHPLHYEIDNSNSNPPKPSQCLEDQVLKLFAESPRPTRDVIALIDAHPGSIRNIVTRLVQSKKIEHCATKGGRKHYRIAEKVCDDYMNMMNVHTEPE